MTIQSGPVTGENTAEFNIYREDLQNYTLEALSSDSLKTVKRVCSSGGDFCCDFEVELKENVTSPNNYQYRYELTIFFQRVNHRESAVYSAANL